MLRFTCPTKKHSMLQRGSCLRSYPLDSKTNIHESSYPNSQSHYRSIHLSLHHYFFSPKIPRFFLSLSLVNLCLELSDPPPEGHSSAPATLLDCDT